MTFSFCTPLSAYCDVNVPQDLYNLEMKQYSQIPPLASKSKHAPGSWYAARTEALRQPKSWFRLRPRPDHSNYAECQECRDRRLRVEQLITEKAPMADIAAQRDKQMEHIQNMLTSLSATSQQSWKTRHTVLPRPFSPLMTSLAATGSSYPCRRMSALGRRRRAGGVVPPMLHTGSNFGCSAFCYSIYSLIELGKLNSSVERVIRQTDGGSDNVAWVTHGVHYMLVHEGAFNQIDWVRLGPGHSYCQQSAHTASERSFEAQHRTDQTFSNCRSIFYPRRGLGPGCTSPMEFEAMLVDGLKEMNGGMEMLWQLANFDFTKWLDGCVAKNERFWRYLFDLSYGDPDFPTYKVRVTFKTKLTDKATDVYPEFKPFVDGPEGTQRKHTDPLGIKFMLQLPRVSDDPGVEAWQATVSKDDEREQKGWNFEKVKKYILATAELERFTKLQAM
eukprot:6209261-Pleurochrysis_carterae.AAC.3